MSHERETLIAVYGERHVMLRDLAQCLIRLRGSLWITDYVNEVQHGKLILEWLKMDEVLNAPQA